MKKLILLFLMVSPFISTGQNVQFAVGASVSKLDWQFNYNAQEFERFYLAPITGLAADLNVEYFEKRWFSLSSNIGYFQSGGEISSDEVHNNWVINETKNSANNFSVGTNFNVIPINKTIQVMAGIGPRLDFLIPTKNTAMSVQDQLRKLQFGITGDLGLYYKFDKIKVGLNASYLKRFGKLIDTEPTNSNNWWEPQKLGIDAQDQWIITGQFVVGFQL